MAVEPDSPRPDFRQLTPTYLRLAQSITDQLAIQNLGNVVDDTTGSSPAGIDHLRDQMSTAMSLAFAGKEVLFGRAAEDIVGIKIILHGRWQEIFVKRFFEPSLKNGINLNLGPLIIAGDLGPAVALFKQLSTAPQQYQTIVDQAPFVPEGLTDATHILFSVQNTGEFDVVKYSPGTEEMDSDSPPRPLEELLRFPEEHEYLDTVSRTKVWTTLGRLGEEVTGIEDENIHNKVPWDSPERAPYRRVQALLRVGKLQEVLAGIFQIPEDEQSFRLMGQITKVEALWKGRPISLSIRLPNSEMERSLGLQSPNAVVIGVESEGSSPFTFTILGGFPEVLLMVRKVLEMSEIERQIVLTEAIGYGDIDQKDQQTLGLLVTSTDRPVFAWAATFDEGFK